MELDDIRKRELAARRRTRERLLRAEASTDVDGDVRIAKDSARMAKRLLTIEMARFPEDSDLDCVLRELNAATYRVRKLRALQRLRKLEAQPR
jgi:hypothetical protein